LTVEHRFRIDTHSPNAEIAGALDRIEGVLLEQDLSLAVAREMRLVAEESMTNVLRHAYRPEEDGSVEIALRVRAGEVRLVVRDRGRAFNPLERASPPLDLPVEERPLGGLGIHLIKALTDEQLYTREGEDNVLVLIRRRDIL